MLGEELVLAAVLPEQADAAPVARGRRQAVVHKPFPVIRVDEDVGKLARLPHVWDVPVVPVHFAGLAGIGRQRLSAGPDAHAL
jgi:hypothetical protein